MNFKKCKRSIPALFLLLFFFLAGTICGNVKSVKAAAETVSLKQVIQNVPSNSASGITISWNTQTGVTGYKIYKKKSSESSYQLVKTVTGASTKSWTDSDVIHKVAYRYKVKAYYKDSLGKFTYGPYSDYKSIVRLSQPSITSLVNTSTGIKLTWKKQNGVSGYKIYKKTYSASSYTLEKTITDPETVTWTSTGLSLNTTYCYKIRAYYDSTIGVNHKSAYSETKYCRRLARPSILELTVPEANKLKVSWGKKDKVDGYELQYSKDSSFSTKTTKTITSNTTTSKVLTSLTSNSTYYVRIRTYYLTSSGTKYVSAWSTVSSKKVVAPASSHPELTAYANYLKNNNWIPCYESNYEYKQMAVFDLNKDGVYEVAVQYSGATWGNVATGILTFQNNQLAANIIDGRELSMGFPVEYVNEAKGTFALGRTRGKAILDLQQLMKTGAIIDLGVFATCYMDSWDSSTMNEFRQLTNGMYRVKYVNINTTNINTYLSGSGKSTVLTSELLWN